MHVKYIVCSDMKVCVPAVKGEKLRRRHLTKLILRLVKMFKLDMALCPNTAKSKDLGAIRYLLHKRYIEVWSVFEALPFPVVSSQVPARVCLCLPFFAEYKHFQM